MEPVQPEDQVPRLQAFRTAHSDIDIRPPGPGRLQWTARRGSESLAACFELKQLLDSLEKLAGS